MKRVLLGCVHFLDFITVYSICYTIEGNTENEGKGKECPRRGHEGPEEK